MSKYFLFIFVILLLDNSVYGNPFLPEETDNTVLNNEDNAENATVGEEKHDNNSGKDLYLIKKVVYEIGILTDSDNSTAYDDKTHEQIDVSFFDPLDNGTFVDLSNIPFPVETNVSGVALTGIISSNFGNLVFPQNGSVASLNESSLPIFPEKQVKVTKNISTVDKDKSASILSGISDVLGLSQLVATQKQDSEKSAS